MSANYNHDKSLGHKWESLTPMSDACAQCGARVGEASNVSGSKGERYYEPCLSIPLTDQQQSAARADEADKERKAISDKPEVFSYWYAFDSTSDKPYIKKEKGSGLLASFESEEDAQRFCQWRQDVKHKEVQYVRLSDHERISAADKARIDKLSDMLRGVRHRIDTSKIWAGTEFQYSGVAPHIQLKLIARIDAALAQQEKRA